MKRILNACLGVSYKIQRSFPFIVMEGFFYLVHEIICDVCFWQFDFTAHLKPDQESGANKISLNQAIENYKRFGVSKLQRKHLVRAPLEEELPENNL
ncbi:CPCC family cysteine-rich protein [Paenibacillus sp. WLX1005]|uniref:CPCC family cysteine-rich protein n=1 Tax=Paenibacillus sp. WLX1005 TaxID=3243766 RepID=UPI003983DFD7